MAEGERGREDGLIYDGEEFVREWEKSVHLKIPLDNTNQ